MNIKDLSLSTLVLGVLYFMAYAFFTGYSHFYGFPDSFISIGVGEVIRFSVFSLFVLFTFVTVLNMHSPNYKLPWGMYIFFFVITLVLSYFFLRFLGRSDYLYESTKSAVHLNALLLAIFVVAAAAAVSTLVSNKFKILNLTHGILLIISLAVLPVSLGWAWAYASYSPFFYSVKYDAYIIDNFGGKYVLGNCKNNKASFMQVSEIPDRVKSISSKETSELKACFLLSAEINRRN